MTRFSFDLSAQVLGRTIFIVFGGGDGYIRATMVILLACGPDTDFDALQILS